VGFAATFLTSLDPVATATATGFEREPKIERYEKIAPG
jgi:hypothetical protein